jgi:ABC-2 type transport system permease protein
MNNNFMTVVGFTARNRLRTKAFIITTIVIAVIICIAVNLPYLISLFSNDEPERIGMVESESVIPAKLQQFFKQMESPSIEIVLVPDEGSANANETALKNKLDAGEIDAYLELEENEAAAFPKVIYKSEKSGFSNMMQLEQGLQAIKTEMAIQDLGLTAEQLALLNAPVELETVQISVKTGADAADSGKTENERAMSMALVYVMIIVLFMGIMITGQLIATEITAEKNSRVMEVLVTSVAPLTQMFGKIFGMFLVGTFQIVFFILVVVINLNLPHNIDLLSSMDLSLSDIDPMVLIAAIFFYLTGYFLYATLYAAIGSIVSRTEELGQAVTPLMFLSMAGFYIGIFSIGTPDSALVKITSFIPFFTPFIMFLRIGLTEPAWWEVGLAIAGLFLSILFFGWLSAKIYRTGVLMYGKRPGWKELRKAMKAYKI